MLCPRRAWPKGETDNETFAIDNDNNITVFASPAEAAAASTTPFDAFASEQNLAEVAAQWPTARLVATWNGLPGVTPVVKFKDRKTAISRIWKRIQSPGHPAQPQADKPEPVAAPEKRKAKSRSAKDGAGIALPASGIVTLRMSLRLRSP